jgi:hypothetical protein
MTNNLHPEIGGLLDSHMSRKVGQRSAHFLCAPVPTASSLTHVALNFWVPEKDFKNSLWLTRYAFTILGTLQLCPLTSFHYQPRPR